MSKTKLQSKKSALRDAPSAALIDPPSTPLLDYLVDDQGTVQDEVFRNGVTDDTKPTLIGRGQEDTLVMVFLDGTLVGSSLCDGNWEFTPDDDLQDGVYTFTARATDAGGTSDLSRTFVFTVDTTAPAQPVIRDVIDDEGPNTGPIPNGGSTDDSTPTIGGGGLDAGDTVFIYDNSVLIGSTTVRGDGTWEFTPDPTEPLDEGAHSVVVVVEDEAGNRSDPSAPWDFEVDLAPPDPPVIDTIRDDQGEFTGNLPNPAITDDTRPTLSGGGLTPDFIVEVRANGQPIGTAVVLADGSWEFEPDTDLPDDTYIFTAIVTDTHGRPSAPSEPWVVEVNTQAPDSGDNAQELIDDRGPITGPIVSGDITDDNTPTYRGIAEPGATVVIYDFDGKLGSVTADPVTGRWDFTPDVPLLNGPHQFYTRIINRVGIPSAPSMVIDFFIEADPPQPPVITLVVDHVDDDGVTGEIFPGQTTDDAQPLIDGSAAPPESVVLLYSNGQFIGSTVADEHGRWYFTPEFPLLNGLNNLTAVAVSPAGVESFPSDVYDIFVDAGGKPAVVMITNVLDAVEPQIGNVPREGFTNDQFPTVVGTSPPGDLVRINSNGLPVGLDVADDDGNWRVRHQGGLLVGRNEITATSAPATDPGNEGPATGPYPVNFDRTAPTPPTLTLLDTVGQDRGPITNGTVTDDANPLIMGRAEPGALVIIYDGTTPLGSVRANETTGAWQFRPDQALRDGPHAISATATDAAGNVSLPSNVVDFTVDTSTLEIAITKVIDNEEPITGPMQPGMSTNDTLPVVEGLSGPLRLVRLYDNAGAGMVEIGSTIANGLGQWQIPTTTPLGEGPHAFVAIDDGKPGAPTAPFQFFVDVTPPDQPAIGDITDDIGDDQGSIGRPGVTDDTTPTFSGDGLRPGDTVTIIDDGRPIGTTIVKEDGTWLFTPPTPVRNGEHEFTIIVTDPAGNSSAPSDPWPVNVGVVRPPKPVIDRITDNFGPITNDLLNPGRTDDNTPTLHGGGLTAGDQVEVSYTNAGVTTVLGTAPVLDDGSWTFDPSTPLGDGIYLFTVVAVAASGGSRSEPSDPWQVTIDTAQPGMAHAVLNDNVGSVLGEIENDGFTDDTKPDYDGIAEENTTVRIFVNSSLVAELPVNDDGTWRYTPTNDLDDGQYTYQTQVVNDVGTEGPLSAPFRFTVDTTAPILPVMGRAEDSVGNEIRNGGTTGDNMPALIGTGEVDATVTVYNNTSIVIGSTTVLADSTWRFAPDNPLTNGIYSFTARQVDPAGNRSPASRPPFVITIQATAPVAKRRIHRRRP